MANPISRSRSQNDGNVGRVVGRGDNAVTGPGVPGPGVISRIDIAGESFKSLANRKSSSGSYHVATLSLAFNSFNSPLPLLILHMLFPLILLLLLFVREWPPDFDSRDLCRSAGLMNGSAPGIISSVRPTLAFGACARKVGVSGTEPDKPEG